MTRIKQDAVLGLVFFAGLALLLFATVKLSNISLTPRPKLPVYFPNALDLAEGDPVFVLGTRYGHVSTVDYEPSSGSNRIRVVLTLNSDLKLWKNHKIKITDSSLLGGKKVSIDPGTSGAGAFDPGAEKLTGLAPLSPIEAFGNLIGADGNRENLAKILSGLADVVEGANSGKGTVGKLIVDSKLYDEALSLVDDLRAVTKEAREGNGTLGKFLKDPKLYDQAEGFFRYAQEVAKAAKEGDGLVAALLSDKTVTDQFRSIIAKIEGVAGRLEKGEGMFGKLLTDPDVARSFQKIMGNVAEASDALTKEGHGVLAAILYDPKLREDTLGVVSDLRNITEGLRKGEGTLGRLIKNEELIHDLERVVKQVTRLMEDARESAPITTFLSMFGGTFN